MSLLEHLNELRKRLFVSLIAVGIGTIVAFCIYPWIIIHIMTPFQASLAAEFGKNLYIHSIFEGFLSKVKVSCITGFVLSLPIHLYNVVRFIFPALKRKEKWALFIGLLSSFILISLSSYFTFTKLIPFILTFMTSSGFVPQDVGLLLNFKHSIFYIIQFIFYSLILFQLPIILEILLAFNLLNRKTLLQSSRYVVIGIFILSALVTPPDFISQISISIPLITLYFITILIAKLMKWGEPVCLD